MTNEFILTALYVFIFLTVLFFILWRIAESERRALLKKSNAWFEPKFYKGGNGDE